MIKRKIGKGSGNEAKKRVRWRSNTNRRESWQAARRRCPNTPATLSKCDAAPGRSPAFSRSVGHRFLAPSSCLVPHSFRLGHVNASNTTGLRAGRFNNASSTSVDFLPSFLPSRLPSLLSRDEGFRNQLKTDQLSVTNIPPCTASNTRTRAKWLVFLVHPHIVDTWCSNEHFARTLYVVHYI